MPPCCYEKAYVCSEGYVPYGWQFPGEDIFVAAHKGFRRNCWGLFGRDNQCHWATAMGSIPDAFVGEQLDYSSWQLAGPTVVALD